MADIGYYGTYIKFMTEDKRTASGFLGADNMVGDRFTIESEYDDGVRTGYIVNPFGIKMGTVDDKILDKVEVLKAKGWTVTALLVFVAFTEEPQPGYYWGELALIAYDPKYEAAFSNWISLVSKKLGSGVRPDLKLGSKGFNQVVESDGSWFPSGRHQLPPKQKGTAIVKSERSSTERLVDQARKNNIGCTIVGWAFILVLVALLVYIIHICGVF